LAVNRAGVEVVVHDQNQRPPGSRNVPSKAPNHRFASQHRDPLIHTHLSGNDTFPPQIRGLRQNHSNIGTHEIKVFRNGSAVAQLALMTICRTVAALALAGVALATSASSAQQTPSASPRRARTAAAAAAQVVVRDQSGAPIEGVKVIASGAASGDATTGGD